MPPTDRGFRRWRRVIVAAGLAGVVAVGSVAGYRLLRAASDDTDPLRGATQHPAPAPTAIDDPSRGSVTLRHSVAIVPGPELEVVIDAPPGATEMQVGLDPTFESTPWTPVTSATDLTTDDVGHHMLFARFRAAEGAEPSAVSVDAVTVDPHFEAATASTHGRHRATWTRPLGPATLLMRVEAGRLARGMQVEYDFDQPPPGDEVSGRTGSRTVERDGEPYGREVDGGAGLLRLHDSLIGQPLDGDDLMEGPWTVVSVDDDHFADGVEPVRVDRITRTAGSGTDADGDRLIPVVHDVIIELDHTLEPGRTYTVIPPRELVEPAELTIDPDRTVSPAVHVNQNGYHPDDSLKVGYLSGLFDGLGNVDYRTDTPFRVFRAESDEVVLEGVTTARPGGDELGRGDLTGSPVFELDFSAVTEPGRYRVCVDLVGCSEEFPVDERVWRDLTVDVARAMYHQRSGVALGPPYTAIGRPRPYHPDDGMIVRESSYRLLDSLETGTGFEGLVNGAGEEAVPEAWGGHFDAGDWDRRIQHLYYVRAVVELVEQHPDDYGGLRLGIPESGDAVPDLLDEGLWTLDLFRRLQRPDGAVSGGVEASEHPQTGNTSWSDDLAVFVYAPDPWSSYLYAGVAAQTASVLEAYDPERAADYGESAQRAMEWAESQPVEEEHADLVAEHRSVAAVALLGLTGDQRWHDVFVAGSTLDDGTDDHLSCHAHTHCDAAWLYLRLDESVTDAAVRSRIEDSVVASADRIVEAADDTSFGWAVENAGVPLVWGLGVGGSPGAIGLLRAYELTGDETYREAAARSAAVTLGANPTNTVYITGNGRNPVRHPLIVDTMNGGLAVWSGTPVYGNHLVGSLDDEGWVDEFVLGPAGVTPLSNELPYLWQWFDQSDVAMFNEFTVFQSHAEAIYAFGLLAAAG